ncbi:tartrate-resistant acid phosphatase type 5-like [Mya arenaria]|uniref:tartrate-resistant acid phosphatase type 5-like n=1 Tax=Mya arenaria TaxID=6604 RepID=UPI0022DF076B|nr:tartrate-resistant acid phosphatase type 5-like [Mya arenaria]
MIRFMFMCIFLREVSCMDSLRFLAVGDWGGIPFWPYDTPIETKVAKQMAKVSEMYQSSFNLALGDNFYSNGVTDVDDKRFKETFEDVYHYDSLMNPWYIVAGNHDHYGNASAQIAYTKRSERWNFPDYYYSLNFKIPGGDGVDIIMIDTVLLCGNTDHDIVGDQPHGPENVKVAEDHWAWLDTQLKSSKAEYLLVAGHFPVYSIAEHGPTKCLTNRLKPMLNKYNVTAYFCGHDHNLQHISSSESGWTVDYFVSGAGNIVEDNKSHERDIPAGSLKFFWAKLIDLGGFAVVEATSKNMTMSFVDGFGSTLYSYTMYSRKS